MRCSRVNAVTAGGVRSVEDAEVKQNLAGTVGGAAIVFRAAAGPYLANIARVQQLLQITLPQIGQGAAGLNQQPGDDLRSDGRGDPLGESQFQCCADELIEVGLQATVGQFVPQAAKFAVYEVVVARSQPSADHQEGDERAGRAVRRQLRRPAGCPPTLGPGASAAGTIGRLGCRRCCRGLVVAGAPGRRHRSSAGVSGAGA